jgi:hypothetical protein
MTTDRRRCVSRSGSDNLVKSLRSGPSMGDHVAVISAGSHPAPGRSASDLLYRRVEAAAERVLRARRFSLVVAVCFALSSAAMVALILLRGGSTTPYALLWAIFTVALAYNVTRFVPRPPPAHELTVDLTEGDALRASEWVASRMDGWRPLVRLSADPIVRVDGDALVIGLPLWLCLRQHELVALVIDARTTAASSQTETVARAFRIVDGGIGRGLRGRGGRDAWASRLLVRRVDAAISELTEAYGEWVDSVRAGRGPDWSVIAEPADTVVEAWDFFARRWLAPALQGGAWHADPFSGLRHFIAACEDVGLIDHQRAWPEGSEATTLLADATGYERALAEMLVASAPHEVDPIAWIEHPRTVTEPRWRSALAAGLHAADRSTGTPQPATLGNFLSLLEKGWGDAIAASVAAGFPGLLEDDGPPTEAVLQHLLEAAISLALLDGQLASMTWRWPHGTELCSHDGGVFPVSAVVAEAVSDLGVTGSCQRLRTWLADAGVDTTTPLWLAGGTGPTPEQAIFAFEAYQGMRTFHVVLSDRALRMFHRRPIQGMREGIRMQMRGADSVLSARLQAVDQGDLADQQCEVPLHSIVQANFTPLVGGHWWRLRLRTPDKRLTLRGNGDGREVAQWIAGTLGDRLSTRWLHTHQWLLRVRNGLGYGCLGIGGFGLILAAIVVVHPSNGLHRADGLAIAVLSTCVVAVGFLPDLAAAVIQRVRRPSPPTRRSLVRQEITG